MATHAPITGAPSRAPVIRHPAALPPMPAVQRVLLRYARHDRETLEAFLSVAIDLLDLVDGDIDREDATNLEDDFALSAMATDYAASGPGCSISDQDAGAYVEWHTMRGSQKRGPNILAGQEDDEDDDAAEQDDHEGQCDEDGVNTAFDYVRFTYGASGPGCMLSDPGGEVLPH